jgi:hypothetical protein
VVIFVEDDMLSLFTKSSYITRATVTVEKKNAASTKIATSQQENLREQQPSNSKSTKNTAYVSTAESTKTGVP